MESPPRDQVFTPRVSELVRRIQRPAPIEKPRRCPAGTENPPLRAERGC